MSSNMLRISRQNIINMDYVIDMELVLMPGRLPDKKVPQINLNLAAGQGEGSPTQFYIKAVNDRGVDEIKRLWGYLCGTEIKPKVTDNIKVEGKYLFQR